MDILSEQIIEEAQSYCSAHQRSGLPMQMQPCMDLVAAKLDVLKAVKNRQGDFEKLRTAVQESSKVYCKSLTVNGMTEWAPANAFEKGPPKFKVEVACTKYTNVFLSLVNEITR